MNAPLNSVREHGFPSGIGQPLALFENDRPLKSHPDYKAAKSGDQVAAVNLVWEIAASFIMECVPRLPKDAVYVAPFARELTGDNAIPQVLASACAAFANGSVDTRIVQVTRVFHTGADPMERLCLRAQFEGVVVAGSEYVLVDDVINMGGTLAELADFIQRGEGKIVAVFALVNAGREKEIVPPAKVVNLLKKRYPNEIRAIFGIEHNALTANEASYLVGFRTADEIRNRLTKAREEIHHRLRSKGIEWATASESA